MNNLLTIALALILTSGSQAVQRAFTPPEAWVRGVCAKTGADPDEALRQREQAAESWASFIEDLANVTDEPEVAEHLGVPSLGIRKLPALELNFISTSVMLYSAFGRGFVKRMLTVPEAVLVRICAKTGADLGEVKQSRDDAAEELLEFVESCVNKHFVATD